MMHMSPAVVSCLLSFVLRALTEQGSSVQFRDRCICALEYLCEEQANAKEVKW